LKVIRDKERIQYIIQYSWGGSAEGSAEGGAEGICATWGLKGTTTFNLETHFELEFA